MKCPEAVRKHDGRVVGFDVSRLAGSIARAACASDAAMMPDAARRLGNEIACAVGVFLVEEGQTVPASADIRALTVKLLRETKHDSVAGGYADHSRAASSLLWRIRVVEPGTPFSSNAGSPWDRRRLLESLRTAGVARDPAGEAAREVERRLVSLGQERISAALIHALAVLVLSQRNIDARSYSTRRLAFSLSAQVPRFDPAAAERDPLPARGPALAAFWTQGVHSPDVVRAARENILSLEPFPIAPADDVAWPGQGEAIDPLIPEMAAEFRNWSQYAQKVMSVRADGSERIAKFGQYLSLLSPGVVPPNGASLNAFLQEPPPKQRIARRAPPVTLNLAGLLAREALRDPYRATIRVAQSVQVAAQAHREREEYFNLSPVRGRVLPVAVAGLWNAAAWMQGESFDAPTLSRPSRAMAATFVSVIRGAIDNLRNETGMELCLAGSAPLEACATLWQRDREFFLRDGVNLDAAGQYDGGPSVHVAPTFADLGERLDFAKDVGSAFDDPPAVILSLPLGSESDSASWRELLSAFAQAGVQRLQLLPGGSSRGMKGVLRLVRSHLEGYPLFEMNDSTSA